MRPTLSHPPARRLLGDKSTSLLNRLLVLSPQHVHVHVLPRKLGDFERNDSVYDEVSVRIFDCLFRRRVVLRTRDPHGTLTCAMSLTQRCVSHRLTIEAVRDTISRPHCGPLVAAIVYCCVSGRNTGRTKLCLLLWFPPTWKQNIFWLSVCPFGWSLNEI